MPNNKVWSIRICASGAPLPERDLKVSKDGGIKMITCAIDAQAEETFSVEVNMHNSTSDVLIRVILDGLLHDSFIIFKYQKKATSFGWQENVNITRPFIWLKPMVTGNYCSKATEIELMGTITVRLYPIDGVPKGARNFYEKKPASYRYKPQGLPKPKVHAGYSKDDSQIISDVKCVRLSPQTLGVLPEPSYQISFDYIGGNSLVGGVQFLASPQKQWNSGNGGTHTDNEGPQENVASTWKTNETKRKRRSPRKAASQAQQVTSSHKKTKRENQPAEMQSDRVLANLSAMIQEEKRKNTIAKTRIAIMKELEARLRAEELAGSSTDSVDSQDEVNELE